ncbi:structural maintenance of chromosomes protein 2-2 [Trichonephila clavipes]|nr:structural maintenance of chromosomes protein 2-2 [Trichonephila clavipes]
MTLPHCRRPLFACRMIYRSSPAVVVLGRPPPTFLTDVPVVWNAFQARETTLLLIPNSAATLVTVASPPAFRSFFYV